MIHPVGRLPPQIYWRRRMFVAGSILLLIVSAFWFFSGGSSGATGNTGSAASTTATPSRTSAEQALTGLEQIVPSLLPAATAAADPAATAVPTEGAAPASQPAPAVPGPCPDAAIGLTVGAEFGQYPAGSKPRVGLNVTNISAVACLRDLDPALQTWGLFAADGTRLWGSNDCYPTPSVPTPRLLQPGEVVAFTIVWSGKTSEPTCTVNRTVVGPGSYILRGYLGALFSPDAGIVIT